ncbi:hypothetical protein Poli38472_007515 [Pythium oligandrum]|uniref:ABC transporter domain-containing protein n=1 Tax=Pythium oligandrum TaxID=41045 RepID=A0A8K1FRR7_PYTOL|nr:hypothetical protein Poli38472_007515 [Pythium oligandrum]|eukprot:TMW67843.1 hypothetical protein Poli38472_007515 [Pythium oligandrum]
MTELEPKLKPALEHTSGKALMVHGPEVLHSHVSNQLETALGRVMHQMEVRFHDISVSADVVMASSKSTTNELPTIANSVRKSVGGIFTKKHKITKQILKNVSGVFEPGTMTLVLGQPGSGKSSVMDIHSDASTFREALTFSAFLRQDSSVPGSVKYASVEECLDLLDLRPIADQIIRGSSVEQMKRLTIGVELAAQPSVLFLDEPTSGLDARSAKLVMEGVRKVANTGRTIVCTIHQPSTEVFMLFDSLLLLKRGGQTVYFGDLGEYDDETRLPVPFPWALPGR